MWKLILNVIVYVLVVVFGLGALYCLKQRDAEKARADKLEGVQKENEDNKITIARLSEKVSNQQSQKFNVQTSEQLVRTLIELKNGIPVGKSVELSATKGILEVLLDCFKDRETTIDFVEHTLIFVDKQLKKDEARKLPPSTTKPTKRDTSPTPRKDTTASTHSRRGGNLF
jgi:hypothetical protein